MFGERPLADAVRFARALASNQLARGAPTLYSRLTGKTGRGEAERDAPAAIAEYFRRSFADYFAVLRVPPDGIEAWLAGKTLLEYGPGDLPGVALLMLAHGARRVHCADRFALLQLTPTNRAALAALEEGCAGEVRARFAAARAALEAQLAGGPASGIDYRIHAHGLAGLRGSVDLAYSRAVLEHVDDLDATFADLAAALAPGGVSVHQVDLKSHGLHRRNPLDFLTWPQPLWSLMYSGKGVPNRWRVDRYRDALRRAGLEATLWQPTAEASARDIAEVRPRLARPFRGTSDADLAWLGFWLVCRHAAPAAAGANA